MGHTGAYGTADTTGGSTDEAPTEAPPNNWMKLTKPALTNAAAGFAAYPGVMRTMMRSRWISVALALVVCLGCHDRLVNLEESRTVGELRQLAAALQQYSGSCGGYPRNLQALLSGPSEPSCDALGAIDKSVRLRAFDAEQGGAWYLWRYEPSAPSSAEGRRFKHYSLSATLRPGAGDWWSKVMGRAPQRSFYVGDTGIITSAKGHAAGPSDVPMR